MLHVDVLVGAVVMLKVLLVGLGGFLGSIARYGVTKVSVLLLGDTFPIGTLLVNVFGSFVMGCLLGLAMFKNGLSEEIRLFLGVGLLGGFTTFSAFSAETVLLLSDSRYAAVFFNVFANLLLSLIATLLGMWLVKP
jgi:CrcB protein